MSFTTINPINNVQGSVSQIQSNLGTNIKFTNTTALNQGAQNIYTAYTANGFNAYAQHVSLANGEKAFTSTGSANKLGDTITRNSTLVNWGSSGKILTGYALAKMIEDGWITTSDTFYSIVPECFPNTSYTGYYVSGLTVPTIDPVANPTGFISGLSGSYGTFDFRTKLTIADIINNDIGAVYPFTLVGTVLGSSYLSGELPLGLLSQAGFVGGLQGWHALQAIHCLYDGIYKDIAFQYYTGYYGYDSTYTYLTNFVTCVAGSGPATPANVQVNYNLAIFGGGSNANNNYTLLNIPGAISGLSVSFAGAPFGNVAQPFSYYGEGTEFLGAILDKVVSSRGYSNVADYIQREILFPMDCYNVKFVNLSSVSVNPVNGRVTFTGARGQVNTVCDSTFLRWGYGGGVSSITTQPYAGFGNAVFGPCPLSLFGIIQNSVPYTYGIGLDYYLANQATLDGGSGAFLPVSWCQDYPLDNYSQANYNVNYGIPTGSATSPFVYNPTGISSSTGWYIGGTPISASMDDFETIVRTLINKGVAPNGNRIFSTTTANWLTAVQTNALNNMWGVYAFGPVDSNTSSATFNGMYRNNRDISDNVQYGFHSNVISNGGIFGTQMIADLESGMIYLTSLQHITAANFPLVAQLSNYRDGTQGLYLQNINKYIQ